MNLYFKAFYASKICVGKKITNSFKNTYENKNCEIL